MSQGLVGRKAEGNELGHLTLLEGLKLGGMVPTLGVWEPGLTPRLAASRARGGAHRDPETTNTLSCDAQDACR